MPKGRTCGAILAAVLILSAVPTAASAAPGGARQAELIHRLKHDCGSCHGLTMKGGLGPPLLPSALAPKSDDELITTILEGVKGTPMPPWHAELTQGEAAWLIKQLRQGLAP